MSRTYNAIFNFGEKIKYLRNKAEMSQKSLSAKAGISQQHLAKIEAGANISEKTLLKIANALGFDDIEGAFELSKNKTEWVQLGVLNVSKKLFSSKEAVLKFNLKENRKKIYVEPEILEKYKGKPLYAYEMPDESLDEIIGVKDVVLILFDDKIKPSPKNDEQILAVEFAGGIKALKLFNYPAEFQDCSRDEFVDTQETYNIKDIKRIIGVAAMLISYKPLLPHVSYTRTIIASME